MTAVPVAARSPVALRVEIRGDGPRPGGWGFHLVAPEFAGVAPGQFVMVAVAPGATVLRRPYWISAAGRWGVELSVTERGPGSRWFAGRRAGDVLDLLGPLGRPVPLPAPGARGALVGDAAAPPLAFLGRALREAGAEVRELAGAADLAALLAAEPGAAVYAAGPRDLLAAATAAAAAAAAPIAVAATPFMACGTGLCGTCAVPILAAATAAGGDKPSLSTVSLRAPAAGGGRTGAGGGAYARACVDGPVLDGHRIDWERWLAEAEPAPWEPTPPAERVATGRVVAGGATGRVAPAEVDLGVDLGPLRLTGPVLAASGTAGGGTELTALVDLTGIGALVAKTVTLEPRTGLPGPRGVEAAGGMLNAIGLANPGVEVWRDRDLPGLAAAGLPLIASIAGRTVGEYGEVAAQLHGAVGLLAVEANISCPNVEDRGRVFATRPAAAAAAVAAAVAASDLPVFAKLTLDVTDIVEVAAAVAEAGATGVTVANTILGLAIDVETGRPKLGGGAGGLSGPAIKPVALGAVAQVARALPDLPIIGLGGVRTVEDVVEFVLAGASAVAVGTATFAQPSLTLDLTRRLRAWLAARGHRSLAELRGRVRW